MKFTDFIRPDLILLDMQAADKQDAFGEFAKAPRRIGVIEEERRFVYDIRQREEKGTTGIGRHIAVPHTTTPLVDRLCLVTGISKHGIDWDATDRKPVHIIFLILIPPGDEEPLHEYLELLELICRLLLRDDSVRKCLYECTTVEDVCGVLEEADKGRFPQ